MPRPVPAIVILGHGSLATARKIQQLYPDALIHGLAERVEGADCLYREFGATLRDLYRQDTPIIALCAAGIVIRTLAPLLLEKGSEPPVLAEALAKLRPAFKTDGTVTAGNASGINDGAAALLLMSAEKAAELGLPPLAAVSGYAAAGVAPEIMGLGAVEAVRAALGKAGWQLADVDLIEGNEAFAAQSLAVMRTLGLDPAKVNPQGGAIALGHPLGATGTIRTATLLHGLQRTGQRWGMVTMCVGTGMGAAGLFESMS